MDQVDINTKGMPAASPLSVVDPAFPLSVSYFPITTPFVGTHLERVFVSFGLIPNPLVLPMDRCPSSSGTLDLLP